MYNFRNIIILTFMLLITVCYSSQINVEELSSPVGVVKELIPPYYPRLFDLDMKRGNLKKHAADYLNRFHKLGLCDWGPVASFFYYSRININKIEEFKKVGIDLHEFSKNFFSKNTDLLKVRALHNLIILKGVVESVEPISNEAYEYVTRYKIKIVEHYKGEKIINDKIKYVYYYSNFEVDGNGKIIGDLPSSFTYKKNDYYLKKGEKVLGLFSKFSYDQKYELYKSETSGKVFLGINHFEEDDGLILKVDGDKFIYSDKVYSIKEYVNMIDQIEKINDTQNFYNIDFSK